MPIINDVAIKNQIDNDFPDAGSRGISGNLLATVLKGVVDWVKNEVLSITPANFSRTYTAITTASGTITANGADQVVNFTAAGAKTATLAGSFGNGHIITIVNSALAGDITVSVTSLAGGYSNPIDLTIRPANTGSTFQTLITVFKFNLKIIKTSAGWSIMN
jgi:hypothetical protein